MCEDRAAGDALENNTRSSTHFDQFDWLGDV